MAKKKKSVQINDGSSEPRSGLRNEANQPDQAYQSDQNTDRPEQRGVSRRQMLKLAAGAIVTVPLASKVMSAAASPRTVSPSRLSSSGAAAAASSGALATSDGPLFFTKEEYAMLDELTEMIIPTDDHSPGARAAKVTEYIDKRLSEAFEDKTRQTWRDGLKTVNDLSQQMNQKPFMESTADQRHSVLAKIAGHENAPTTDGEKFFGELKSWTAFGYYTTKIGIHQEIEYKGNVYQREYSGYDAT